MIPSPFTTLNRSPCSSLEAKNFGPASPRTPLDAGRVLITLAIVGRSGLNERSFRWTTKSRVVGYRKKISADAPRVR